MPLPYILWKNPVIAGFQIFNKIKTIPLYRLPPNIRLRSANKIAAPIAAVKM